MLLELNGQHILRAAPVSLLSPPTHTYFMAHAAYRPPELRDRKTDQYKVYIQSLPDFDRLLRVGEYVDSSFSRCH